MRFTGGTLSCLAGYLRCALRVAEWPFARRGPVDKTKRGYGLAHLNVIGDGLGHTDGALHGALPGENNTDHHSRHQRKCHK
jgi:hypothetical protein